MNLKDKIKAYRIENKLTQKQLADMVGVSRTNIAEIEGGRINGTLKFLNKLSKATNKPLSYWATGKDIEKNYTSYEALDTLVEAMIDTGAISEDGNILLDRDKKLILSVLEKEIKLKLQRKKSK